MSKQENKFRTAYSTSIRINCPSGSEMQNEYAYEINGKGQKQLVKTGETNRYQKIQEALEETKIENILKRVAAGDTSDFRPEGIYEDVSKIPNNLIEARKEMQKIENLWNRLDNEIKAKYNWSVDEFMAETGKAQWLVDAGFVTEQKTETKTEPPKETNDNQAEG